VEVCLQGLRGVRECCVWLSWEVLLWGAQQEWWIFRRPAVFLRVACHTFAKLRRTRFEETLLLRCLPAEWQLSVANVADWWGGKLCRGDPPGSTAAALGRLVCLVGAPTAVDFRGLMSGLGEVGASLAAGLGYSRAFAGLCATCPLVLVTTIDLNCGNCSCEGLGRQAVQGAARLARSHSWHCGLSDQGPVYHKFPSSQFWRLSFCVLQQCVEGR
jgi:hypothetical protein